MSTETIAPISAKALFREHARFVARFVVRCGIAPSEVDDVLQDVFLVAHAHGGYRPGPARPTSWLAAIAVRIAASHRRRARVRAFASGGGDLVDAARSETPSPETSAAIDREMARLHVALGELTPEQRLAFILFEMEGESCASIAAASGVPIGTVHSRLHLARRRLREALEPPRELASTKESRWMT